MGSLNPPDVKPYTEVSYKTAQPDYAVIPALPARCIVAGPSGQGKGVLIQNLLLKYWRNKFAKIFYFSPTVNLDPALIPVKEYAEKVLGQDDWSHDRYDSDMLQEIIDTQTKVCDYIKKKKPHGGHMHSICIVLDDLADDAKIFHGAQGKPIVSLFLRGRHIKITTVCSTQIWKALHPHIRRNALSLFVFKLRSQAEVQAFAEELSALHPHGRQGILDLYREATDEPHSYLYVDLTAKRPADMFFRKWKKLALINESSTDSEGLDDAEQDRAGGRGHPRQAPAIRDR